MQNETTGAPRVPTPLGLITTTNFQWFCSFALLINIQMQSNALNAILRKTAIVMKILHPFVRNSRRFLQQF